MRERLLTQHFLQRFLENDLLSPEADRHDAIAMACGGLLTLGLFVSIGMSMQFLFMPFQSPGRTAMLAMGDRLFFVAISMIVMALVAVLTWDALSLDARDTAMFGPLPIERGLIVRAKLRAVGILAGGFALAISSLSSVFHPSLMVAKLSDWPDPRSRADRDSSGHHAGGGSLRLRLRSRAARGLAGGPRDAVHSRLGGAAGGHDHLAGHQLPAAAGDP